MNKDKETLLKRIQQLSFAKCETELFLDTHPQCMEALGYYKKIVDELQPLMTEYQEKYGPLVASAVTEDRWSWVDTPWPWQLDMADNKANKDKRNGEVKK